MQSGPQNTITPLDWQPNSWQKKPAVQLPRYPDTDALEKTLARLNAAAE